MATHKSAVKRAKQNSKRRLRNRTVRSAYRSEIKNFLSLIEDKNLEDAKTLLPHIHQIVDKAHSKGVIHKKTASRNKSNLSLALNKALGQA